MKVSRILPAILALTIAGCSAMGPTTQPSEAEQKQATVLHDPMGYDHGVGTGSLGKDLNDIINP